MITAEFIKQKAKELGASICGIGNIKLEKWYKFFLPICGILYLLQMVFVQIAVMIGF